MLLFTPYNRAELLLKKIHWLDPIAPIDCAHNRSYCTMTICTYSVLLHQDNVGVLQKYLEGINSLALFEKYNLFTQIQLIFSFPEGTNIFTGIWCKSYWSFSFSTLSPTHPPLERYNTFLHQNKETMATKSWLWKFTSFTCIAFSFQGQKIGCNRYLYQKRLPQA